MKSIARSGTGSQEHLQVLYDGPCGFCVWTVGIFLRMDRNNLLSTRAIQDSMEMLPAMTQDDALRSFHLVNSSGEIFSAGAGLSTIMQTVAVLRPLGKVLGRFPGIADWIYFQVAGRRALLAKFIPERSKQRARTLVSDAASAPPVQTARGGRA